jgi:hypothetical protein
MITRFAPRAVLFATDLSSGHVMHEQYRGRPVRHLSQHWGTDTALQMARSGSRTRKCLK